MPNSTVSKTLPSHLQEPIVPAARGETQPYGTARRNPLALNADAAAASIDNLNQLLADTLTLASLYKKHHWQASGPHFYSMHLLFDKHYEEQGALADILAERVQTLLVAYRLQWHTTLPIKPSSRVVRRGEKMRKTK